jgi:peptidoglycan glycosyltransferase
VVSKGHHTHWSDRRRRRLLTRGAPLVVLAGLAFAAGVVEATSPAGAERAMVKRYVTAWTHGDFAAMYAMLDPASKAGISEADFVAAYQRAAATATLTRLRTVRVTGPGGQLISVRMVAHTRIFGTLRATLEVPFSGSGSGSHVHFARTLLFPGLAPGGRLTRQVALGARGNILARDGTPLAEGPARTSPIPAIAGQITGTLGPIPAAEAQSYGAQGYPAGAKVGLDGLERIFQSQLAGTPGGELFAGSRVLARTLPVPGATVTTTIDPSIEAASIAAMGSALAGIAAVDPRNGQVLALSGIAFSAPQPPGSTMKIITATAVLQAGIATPATTFPIQTSANVGGYIMQNANGEACGGTLLNAFAVSCNSVFAPLGITLGGARLVAMAKRFGFDQPPQFAGEIESTIPSAANIGDATSVGSSAIGQGQVETTPLEMADAGATIAMGGRRPIPTLELSQQPSFVPVTSAHIAAEVQRMMVAVVQYGTGTAAQIAGVQVAGKTGTAELTDTATAGASTAKNTDAWFVAYAPVGSPRIVAAALFPNQGFGGATAAPAVRQVIEAALSAHY